MAERRSIGDTTCSLNALLASLEIPLVLSSPLELSPPLILTIFESMLRTHLPVSAETRLCMTYSARVEVMKIFIGVLEDDVLGIEVGLGDLDPRKLADGRKGEVLRVAETLCWLGKRMNYLSQDGLSVGNVARSRDVSGANEEDNAVADLPDSPSMLSAMSTGHESSLLIHSTHSFDDSQTTVTAPEAASQSILDEEEFSLLAQSPGRRDFLFSDHARRHDIDEELNSSPDLQHLRMPSRRYDFESEEEEEEEEEEDIDGSDAYCHCDSELWEEGKSIALPVRTSGYLETVNFDDELRLYELQRRNMSNNRNRRRESLPSSLLPDSPTRTPRSSKGIVTRHTSPVEYTLALLEERARLLCDLAKLKQGRD